MLAISRTESRPTRIGLTRRLSRQLAIEVALRKLDRVGTRPGCDVDQLRRTVLVTVVVLTDLCDKQRRPVQTDCTATPQRDQPFVRRGGT